MKNVYVVGGVAFVPHPLLRGFWLRTDPAVAKVDCPYPDCGSKIGEPCRFKRGYGSSTHYVRRDAAKRLPLPEGVETRITIKTP